MHSRKQLLQNSRKKWINVRYLKFKNRKFKLLCIKNICECWLKRKTARGSAMISSTKKYKPSDKKTTNFSMNSRRKNNMMNSKPSILPSSPEAKKWVTKWAAIKDCRDTANQNKKEDSRWSRCPSISWFPWLWKNIVRESECCDMFVNFSPSFIVKRIRML